MKLCGIIAVITLGLSGCATTNSAPTTSSVANGTIKTASLCDANKEQNPSVTPIIRVEPKYPVKAARAGLGGYVVMDFDVTKNGKTSNIRVTESYPSDLFVSAAKASLSKWLYKPAVEDGKTVASKCLNVRLDFRLG
ncbi:energy transducer TonB [Psychrosphaera algicola]|uniref:Protein TonB n=1 Tax=Psychrosphaera algicola TaxID=3023714 RepID=A0ABT5FCV2_9GAMM|nr:energy transducer TonB [Psychrosphaera sp. G1-22]MDC2889358.1 energy transducer TonB [Psychrosphaera sp. G1-22]